MDARKPDPATQSCDRIETRPPEDIFSSLPPEAPVPDGQPRKRSLFARILQVFRLIFVGDAEREQRPATGMAARLRENFSQASSAGDKPMTRKELFAALDAPLHGLMPDDINYASEVDAALSRRPAFTARALSVAVALLVVALLVWAAWAPIDEVTHAEGSVVGSRRTQSVSNLEGGILQAVLVREGEVVEKGQVVAQLENVMAESSYRDALYKLVEHRLAIMRLEAMLRDEEPVFPSDLPSSSRRYWEKSRTASLWSAPVRSSMTSGTPGRRKVRNCGPSFPCWRPSMPSGKARWRSSWHARNSWTAAWC